MKAFIACLLLTTLLEVILPLSFSQQNQTTQKSNPEIEALKNRISELENKLQTVENVEKMELTAKLAEAQAKLRDAEFGKLERDLRDSNHKWLTGWILFFLAIIAVAGRALWLQFKSKADQLVEDEVEKSLNGFKEAVAQVDTLKNELKEAVGQVNILQDQIRILEKEHAVSVLADFVHLRYSSEESFGSEQIKPIPDRALLYLLADKTRDLSFRYKAVEVLVAR